MTVATNKRVTPPPPLDPAEMPDLDFFEPTELKLADLSGTKIWIQTLTEGTDPAVLAKLRCSYAEISGKTQDGLIFSGVKIYSTNRVYATLSATRAVPGAWLLTKRLDSRNPGKEWWDCQRLSDSRR